jgi:hypothetical protein
MHHSLVATSGGLFCQLGHMGRGGRSNRGSGSSSSTKTINKITQNKNKFKLKHLIKKQKSSAFASFGLLDLGWVQLL